MQRYLSNNRISSAAFALLTLGFAVVVNLAPPLVNVALAQVGCNSGNVAATALLSSAACQATAAANSTAVGAGASATGTNASAFGQGASATDSFNVAVGSTSSATGLASTAVGGGASSAGTFGSAFGELANAGGTLSTALGSNSSAGGANSTAVGVLSFSSGANSTAVGNGSFATGANSTAVGQGATAAFANSAAIGQGAAATRADQQVFGTATNTYTMSGINSAASKAAQTGPTSFVTTDANGNLATASFSATDISSLQGRVGVLESNVAVLQQQMKQSFEGTAIAIAMGASALPSDKRFAVSTNWGTFRGQNAGSFLAQMRVSNNIVVNAGVGAGFAQSGVGGRAGLTYAW